VLQRPRWGQEERRKEKRADILYIKLAMLKFLLLIQEHKLC
jgi:hypothetical protein